VTVDEAVERIPTEYLGDEKGRADKTVNDYCMLHHRWCKPTIGSQPVKRVDTCDHRQLRVRTCDRLRSPPSAATTQRRRGCVSDDEETAGG
jgi:hypothetical protein